MTTITIEKAIVHRALSALEYHTQQTRPIHNTELVIEELRAALAPPVTAPEQMPLERDCICHQDLHIDGYSGGAAPEGLYGALWVVVEGVGKKYVLADQSSEPKDMLALATTLKQPRPFVPWSKEAEMLESWAAQPATAPDLSAAYIGAREDLAVWKKRALEAEETARQLNRALAEEVNGPTFMGEPVLPATAPEKTVKEIMEFVRHYAADTFSSAMLEDKIRRSLAAPATAPAWYDAQQAEIESLRWTVKDALESLDNGMTADCRATLSSATKETP